MRLFLPVALALSCACSGSPDAPRPKPLPERDPYPPLLGPGPLSPRIANYTIAARYDAATHRIAGELTLRWTNPAGRAVDTLPLHLYLNAFKNEDSVFMRESRGRHRRAEASDTGWGWIDLRSVRVAGVDLLDQVQFPGPDETVAEIRLTPAGLPPVAPGGEIQIDIGFAAQLPEVFARTGYKGDFALVGQWFPKIGVLVGESGQERWHCEPFHLNSEFFADFGVYDVALTVPVTHTVAATGVLASAVDNGDGSRTLRYRAEDVHDFAWMVDPHAGYISGTARTDNGPVEVRVYHRPAQREFAERHLRAGIGAIENFSRLYLPYPWPLMSIIDPPPQAAQGAGGMEYPTFVTTAGDSYLMRPGIRLPEYVTVHEVGHNWFQGILASNEVDEAWLDEGVNDYADAIVMAAVYGEDASLFDWAGLRGDIVRVEQTRGGPLHAIPSPIATRSYEFADFGSYAEATYRKTALALTTLENIVGVEEFRAAMRAYARRWAFRHPTGDDFFASLADHLGRDPSWFLGPAFHTVGAVDYEVRDFHCRRERTRSRGVFGRGDDMVTVPSEDAPETDTYRCDVVIANLGLVPAPVDVEIEFEDGEVRRESVEIVPGGGPEPPPPDQGSAPQAWRRVTVKHTARIARVTIDPDNKLVLDNGLRDREIRAEAHSSAARRAGARIEFWTQSAMQVFGL